MLKMQHRSSLLPQVVEVSARYDDACISGASTDAQREAKLMQVRSSSMAFHFDALPSAGRHYRASVFNGGGGSFCFIPGPRDLAVLSQSTPCTLPFTCEVKDASEVGKAD